MASTIETSSSWPWQILCSNDDRNYEVCGIQQVSSSSSASLCLNNNGNREHPSSVSSSSSSITGSIRGMSASATTMYLASEYNDIGNSFSNLSMKEKESALNDLHGCPDVPNEDPEMTAKKLAELDSELRKRTDSTTMGMKLSTAKTTHKGSTSSISSPSDAYIMAYHQDKTYVEDRKFRLAFLRAEMYQVREASQRIFAFFEHKLHLFGEEKLTKPIMYQDLSQDDLDSLHSGALQLLPMKDRAGRPVIVALGSSRQEKKLENYESHPYVTFSQLRAHFYFCMKILDISDETLQTRGYVGILYNMAGRSSATPKGMWAVARLRNCLPLRMSAGHICYKDNSLKIIFTTAIRFLPSKIQHRMTFHFGSHTECSYALKGYGIPTHLLPIIDDGRTNPTKNGIETGHRGYRYPTDRHMKLIGEMREADLILWMQKTRQHPNNQQVVATDVGEPNLLMELPQDVFDVENGSIVMDSFSASAGGIFDDDGDEIILDRLEHEQVGSFILPSNENLFESPLPTSSSCPSPVGTTKKNENERPEVDDVSTAASTTNTMISNHGNPTNNPSPSTECVVSPARHQNQNEHQHQRCESYACRQRREQQPKNKKQQKMSQRKIPSPTEQQQQHERQDQQQQQHQQQGGGRRTGTKKKVVMGRDGTITELYPQDVLLGRGRPVNEYTGNVYYRQIITSMVDSYEIANKQDKTIMASLIVQKIKCRGGRFVKRVSSAKVTFQEFDVVLHGKESDDNATTTTTTTNDNCNRQQNNNITSSPLWQEIDDITARLKVAAAFRTLRGFSTRRK